MFSTPPQQKILDDINCFILHGCIWYLFCNQSYFDPVQVPLEYIHMLDNMDIYAKIWIVSGNFWLTGC